MVVKFTVQVFELLCPVSSPINLQLLQQSCNMPPVPRNPSQSGPAQKVEEAASGQTDHSRKLSRQSMIEFGGPAVTNRPPGDSHTCRVPAQLRHTWFR
ncbi:hypothetical protein MHYP_G00207240 [Metynnis hypsauchen]